MRQASFTYLPAFILVLGGACLAVAQTQPSSNEEHTTHLTAQQDRTRLLGLLGIKESNMRPAPVPDAKAPNAANYDEAKANVFPKLPDPLVFKDGKPVKSGE